MRRGGGQGSGCEATREEFCEQGAQWAIGATRCDDKCAKTVLLETQGPCGSLRKCSGDIVTHDTRVQVKMSHP